MQWFASELQTVCAIDLKNEIGFAQDGLRGLQAYAVMRSSACLINQVSDAYCFVEAVQASDQSDFYYYGIPLGMVVPNNTGLGSSPPSCDACTQSVMNIYEPATASVEALKKTYGPAAQLADQKCGTGYVLLGPDEPSDSGTRRMSRGEISGWVTFWMLLVVFGWENLL